MSAATGSRRTVIDIYDAMTKSDRQKLKDSLNTNFDEIAMKDFGIEPNDIPSLRKLIQIWIRERIEIETEIALATKYAADLKKAESKLARIGQLMDKETGDGVFFGFWKAVNNGILFEMNGDLQRLIFGYCGIDFYLNMVQSVDNCNIHAAESSDSLKHYFQKLLCESRATQIELFYVGKEINWQDCDKNGDLFVTRLIKTNKVYTPGDQPNVKMLCATIGASQENEMPIRGYMRLDNIDVGSKLCEYTIVVQGRASLVEQFCLKLEAKLGFEIERVNEITKSRWFKSFDIIKPTRDGMINAKQLGISVYESEGSSMGCFGIDKFPNTKTMDYVDELSSTLSEEKSIEKQSRFRSLIENIAHITGVAVIDDAKNGESSEQH